MIYFIIYILFHLPVLVMQLFSVVTSCFCTEQIGFEKVVCTYVCVSVCKFSSLGKIERENRDSLFFLLLHVLSGKLPVSNECFVFDVIVFL